MQIGKTHVKDLHDVRMREIGLGFDLSADEQKALDVVELAFVQQLQSDQLPVRGVACQPHVPHASFAQLADQLIGSDHLGRLGKHRQQVLKLPIGLQKFGVSNRCRGLWHLRCREVVGFLLVRHGGFPDPPS